MTQNLMLHAKLQGCDSKARDKVIVKVGNLGVITLLLCSNCVPKFQEVEQT